MPISDILDYAEFMYDQMLEMHVDVLTAQRTQGFSSTAEGEVSHYINTGKIQCQIGPRTRREAALFKSDVQDVQGELILIIKSEDRHRLSDKDAIRTTDTDYTVRFDVNDFPEQQVFAQLILEKQGARLKVI